MFRSVYIRILTIVSLITWACVVMCDAQEDNELFPTSDLDVFYKPYGSLFQNAIDSINEGATASAELLKKEILELSKEEKQYIPLYHYLTAYTYYTEDEYQKSTPIFKSIIKKFEKNKEDEYKHLLGLCHLMIGFTNYWEEDYEIIDSHMNAAYENLHPLDLNSIDKISQINQLLHLNTDKEKYLKNEVILFNIKIQLYIYSFFRFSSTEKKDNLFHLISVEFDRLAYFYEYYGDIKTAKSYYQSAANFTKKKTSYERDLNTDNYNLAYISFFLNEFDKSELLAKDILRINKGFDVPDLEIESGCLALLGDIRNSKYDYINAKKYYEEAMKVAQKLYSPNNFNLQYFHEGLAIINYKLENYNESAFHYKKALDLIRAENGKNKLSHLIGLADSYSFIDKNKAKEIYKQALEISELNSETHQINAQTRIYYKLGLLLEKENPKEAIDYHKLSRNAHFKSKYPIEEGPINIVKLAEYHKADTHQHQVYMDEAIKANLKKNSSATSISYKDILFPIQLLECYHKLGDYYSGKDDDKALEYYIKSKELISEIKPRYKFEGSKSALTKESIPIYEKITLLCLKKYKETKDDKYFSLAFEVTEKSKSVALTDALNNNEALKFSGIPDSIMEYGQALRTELATLNEELNTLDEEITPEEQDAINEEIVVANTKYHDYLLEIEQKYPNYYSLKYEDDFKGIKKIQNSLRRNEVIIEYQIQDSLLIIFGISKRNKILISKGITKEELEEDIEDLMKGIYDLKNDNFIPNSFSLHQLLLKEVREVFPKSKKYIVIPDGILNYLSFELLSEKPEAFTEIIRSKSVIYQYSTKQLNHKSSVKNNHSLLGISPRYYSDFYDALPYAKREIQNINKIWDGDLLIDEEATLGNFKTASQNHTLVHIAGHTELNHDYPLQSRLVFSESDYDIHSLYAYELYNMNLDVEMVTLSACNSGIGKIKEGEGSMSLARGFAYAGCPSTVTTLWPMTDRPTMDIMTRYYKNLKKGYKKSKALRKAKLDFLKHCGPKSQSPYLWAGIVIIGSDSPLYPLPIWQRTWFLILLASLLFLLLYLGLRRIKR